ncbi:hypothetical protein D7Y15_10840 [Corallococcus sp. AB030]|nr:hypothetical protein D7V77_04725 [Corallococcus sp. CA041A]RKI17193.1 hypothetical protein D7Y15_10840 [Corallococcus sp. AB030]RUO95013.1 hypothetical protein D7Y11_01660 [Corallococcus sp. AB018]
MSSGSARNLGLAWMPAESPRRPFRSPRFDSLGEWGARGLRMLHSGVTLSSLPLVASVSR